MFPFALTDIKLLAFWIAGHLTPGYWVVQYEVTDVRQLDDDVRRLYLPAIAGCREFGGCPDTGIFRSYFNALSFQRAIFYKYSGEYPVMPVTIARLSRFDKRVQQSMWRK